MENNGSLFVNRMVSFKHRNPDNVAAIFTCYPCGLFYTDTSSFGFVWSLVKNIYLTAKTIWTIPLSMNVSYLSAGITLLLKLPLSPSGKPIVRTVLYRKKTFRWMTLKWAQELISCTTLSNIKSNWTSFDPLKLAFCFCRREADAFSNITPLTGIMIKHLWV